MITKLYFKNKSAESIRFLAKLFDKYPIIAPNNNFVVYENGFIYDNILDNNLLSDTTYTLGTGWILLNNEYFHTSGSTDSLTTSESYTSGNTYYISYNLSNITAGSITINVAGNTITDITESGTSTIIASSSDSIEIVPTADFQGIINISSIEDGSEIKLNTYSFKILYNTLDNYKKFFDSNFEFFNEKLNKYDFIHNSSSLEIHAVIDGDDTIISIDRYLYCLQEILLY